MVAPLEREVQAAVKKLFRQIGAKVWDTSQTRRSHVTPGLLDLFVIVPGKKAFFFETKTPDGRVSAAQKDFLAAAFTCDVRVVVGGRDDAMEFLQEIGVL